MFFKKVISEFEKKKIKYVLVGGFAVALHGLVRGTIDIDLVIRINEKNFEDVEKLLIGIGLQPRLPVTARDVFRFREEYIKNRNMIAWAFTNPKNPTEAVDIIITHSQENFKSVFKKIGDLSISVASIEDLIKMKKLAGRPQDLVDIKALEKIL